jgi:hypothetical protein
MSAVSRRLLAIFLLIIVSITAAFFVEAFLSLGTPLLFAHTGHGHLMGWAGLGATLLVLFYPVKKRMSRNRRWPRGWFQVHMVAGMVGPLLILLHSGAHMHAIVPILALATMSIVVVSGIIGQGVHYVALRALNDRRRQLHEHGLSDEEIDWRLREMAAQEEAFRVWQSIHAPMTVMFLTFTAMHVVGALFFGGL